MFFGHLVLLQMVLETRRISYEDLEQTMSVTTAVNDTDVMLPHMKVAWEKLV